MSQVFYPACRVILSVVFDGFGLKGGVTDPFSKRGGDSDPTIVQVIPRESQCNLTGYKEADTWSMSFDAKALPFSPDLIRAINVEIYMFDAKSVNPEAEAFASPDHLVLAGIADAATLEASGNGREFTCDGRDYTALLIDKHWDPKIRVPVGSKISKVVQQVVDIAVQSNTHGGRTLTVEYVSTQPEPIVGQYHTKTTKKGKPVKKGETAWDVIYKICISEGLIVFVRAFKVIITDPQTLTLLNANKARRVAYGRNLSSLKINRKLGKEKTPQIEVTSYSSKLRQQIIAKFPESKDQVTTGIGTKKDDLAFFVVNGVDDPVVLKRYAETMYNNLARGEAKIHFTTRSLTDLTDRVEVAQDALGFPNFSIRSGLDMLQLRAGDPIIIGFDPFNEQVMESSTPEQRFQYLREQGYSSSIARLVSVEYDRIDQFKRPFYTRDVEIKWSSKEGITLDVEAVNFVSLGRDDVTAKTVGALPKIPKSTDNSEVGEGDEGEVDE